MTNDDELKILTNHADAAALMLAAADDREAMSETIKALTYNEAAELMLSALEVGGTLVRLGDRNPQTTARDTLSAIVAACRDGGEA